MPWRRVAVLSYVVRSRCRPDPRGTALYSGGTVLGRLDGTEFGRHRPDFYKAALYLGSVVLRRSDDVVFGQCHPKDRDGVCTWVVQLVMLILILSWLCTVVEGQVAKIYPITYKSYLFS